MLIQHTFNFANLPKSKQHNRNNRNIELQSGGSSVRFTPVGLKTTHKCIYTRKSSSQASDSVACATEGG